MRKNEAPQAKTCGFLKRNTERQFFNRAFKGVVFWPRMYKIRLTLGLWLILILGFSSGLYSQEKKPSVEDGPAKQDQQETPKTNPSPGLISLNLKDVNIEDALKIISEASGLNIVLDKDVKAKITINLKDVSWQTALETLLQTNELTYRIQGNIIRIMTLTTVKKEEETLPLSTKIVSLNFAKAEEMRSSLSKIISTRGTVDINIATNSLIINDSPENLDRIEKIIKQLDTRTPQVMVEALIISVKNTNDRQTGMSWTSKPKTEGLKNSRYLQQTLDTAQQALDIYYGKTILPSWNISAHLQLFAEDSRVTILASPRILTLDNLAAQIEILEQVPYTYTSSSTEGGSVTSTQFKDIGIKLYVTPHITKEGTISLSVKGEQSFVAEFVGTTNEPSIDSRKVETNFMLRNGDTAVIGGLKRKDNTTTIDKVPVLGDIPWIGKIFFSSVAKQVTDTELIIFISPRIMTDTLMSRTEEVNFADASAEITSMTPEQKSSLRKTAITEALNKLSQIPQK